MLDGRNRYLAAKEHPEMLTSLIDNAEIYEGADPVAYIISKNLHRRQMTTGPRATSAARLANLPPHRPVRGNGANLRTFVVLADAASAPASEPVAAEIKAKPASWVAKQLVVHNKKQEVLAILRLVSLQDIIAEIERAA